MSIIDKEKIIEASKLAQPFKGHLKKVMMDSAKSGLTMQEQLFILNLIKMYVYEAIGFHVELGYSDPNEFIENMISVDPKAITAAFNIGATEAKKIKNQLGDRLISVKP